MSTIPVRDFKDINLSLGDKSVDVLDDEKFIAKASKLGGKRLTKEQILAMNQPLGGEKLTWEQYKIRNTPLG